MKKDLPEPQKKPLDIGFYFVILLFIRIRNFKSNKTKKWGCNYAFNCEIKVW